MTRLRIEFDYDPDDQTALRQELDTDKGDRFFVAWRNPVTDLIEWTCTDPEYPGGPYFEALMDAMEDGDAA